MRVVAVFRERSEYSRSVEEFMHDFEARTGRHIEALDPDSLEGQSFCQAYGIMSYPTLIAVADDSTMQHWWEGLPLPTIMEVSFYA